MASEGCSHFTTMVKGATVLPNGRTRALTEPTWTPIRTVPRLSDIMSAGDSRDFRSIATLPSNIEAVEAALLFSAKLETLVAIVGPSGWGKSRLLEAVARRLRVESGLAVPQSIDAEDWLSRSGRTPLPGAAIVDNVQTCLTSPRQRQLLRVLLERRVKSRRPTLLSFTSAAPNRQIRSLLPQSREWLVAHLKEPTPTERELVLREMSVGEGLSLSDQLITLLAHTINGNGRTLCGALNRLKLHQGKWTTPRETLRACGILNPFFADNSGWDLRERIIKVVARQSAACRTSNVDPLSASVYLMLREALLSEAEVSNYLKMQPKEAYAVAGSVDQLRQSDEGTATCLSRLVSDVTESLLGDRG
jgi:chromosomal replication initiation ATPase DnaA